jgi:hypothetical protein
MCRFKAQAFFKKLAKNISFFHKTLHASTYFYQKLEALNLLIVQLLKPLKSEHKGGSVLELSVER